MIYVRSVTIILALQDKREVVIGYIRHRGRDPRINIQNDKGKAKDYQVKQVLKAIEMLEADYGTKK